jgi:hypothetical protein
MSIVVTAGQRGDSPQFEPVLAKVRVPRLGPGRPRVRPDRVRADKAYASRKNRACAAAGSDAPSRTRPTRHATARSSALAAADLRASTRPTTASAMRSSAGSTASRETAPSPRATTSSPSATRHPSSSLPSTSGCDPRPSRGGVHLPRRRQIAAAEEADEVFVAHDVVLLTVGGPSPRDTNLLSTTKR